MPDRLRAMIFRSRRLWFLALLAGPLLPVDAGAVQRTFVSSLGSDANACNLAAPCRTFSAALAKTDVGGEVVVLTSAGYGLLNITQSVSIIAPQGVYGGITTLAGEVGITVNASVARVVLSGLTVNGQGGDDGIVIAAADSVMIERCVVSNNGNDPLDVGVRMTGSNMRVTIRDTIIRDNAGKGVHVSAGTGSSLLIDRSRIENNLTDGIRAGDSKVAVHNSIVSGNGLDGFVGGDSSGNSRFTLARSTLSKNGSSSGVFVTGSAGSFITTLSDNVITGQTGINGKGLNVGPPGTVVVMTRNSIVGNGMGIRSDNGGTVRSAGDNAVDSNTSPDIATITPATVK